MDVPAALPAGAPSALLIGGWHALRGARRGRCAARRTWW